MMVARFSARCDADRLRSYLRQQLSKEAEAEIDRHLETCRACQRKLESLAADPQWWIEAGQCLQTQSGVRLRPADGAKANQEVNAAGEELAAMPSGAKAALALLGPSDNPKNLGRVGPYEIVAVLGSGGMGVVLKGFDAALSRYVAIKVLAPHLAGSGAARQRFAREARAAAAVSHEHVVAIHAVDTQGDLPYLVMPLISGESLQQRIDRCGALELKEILRIGMQIAAGLAAAHAQGVVHRDIKPANILLEKGVERVMITDFGLARAVDDATLTCTGVVAGTPQYMAPEQARGEPADPRTDLFSLGSVLYAMCTGGPPFRAETALGVLRRICDDGPQPLRSVNPDIPVWLAEIVEKLHAKGPAERFASAAEVAQLLEQHLAHLQQPLAFPRPARLRRRRLRPVLRRHWQPLAVVAAGIVLLITVIGTLAATRLLAPARHDPTTADRPESGSLRPASQQPPASSPDPTAGANPPVVVVTPEMLQWNDGLDGNLWAVDRQIQSLAQPVGQTASDQPSPDPLPALGTQVDGLQNEVKAAW